MKKTIKNNFFAITISITILFILHSTKETFQEIEEMSFPTSSDGASQAFLYEDHFYVTILSDPIYLLKFSKDNFDIADFLNLESDEVWSSVVYKDAVYLGTDGEPGHIIQVNLTTFKKGIDLVMEENENYLDSIAFDGNHTAYFTTVTSPANVIKVDLETFTRVNATQLRNYSLDPVDSESSYGCGIDTVNKFLYASSDNEPTRIWKVDLENFELVDTLEMEANDIYVDGFIIANKKEPEMTDDLMYVSTWTSPMQIIIINLTDFSRVGLVPISLTNNPEESWRVYFDNETYKAYFPSDRGIPLIVVIQANTSKYIETLQYPNIFGVVESMQLEHANNTTYGYAGLMDNGGVARLNLDNQSDFKNTSLPSFNQTTNIVIDEETQFAYITFFLNANYSLIVNFNLSDFSFARYQKYPNDDPVISSSHLDKENNSTYFLVGSYNFQVYILSLIDDSINHTEILSNSSPITSIFDETNHLLYSVIKFTENSSCSILKITTPDFGIIDKFDFYANTCATISAFDKDRNIGYFIGKGSSGKYNLFQIDLTDLSLLRSLELHESAVTSMVFDSLHNSIYFVEYNITNPNRNETGNYTYFESCPLYIVDLNKFEIFGNILLPDMGVVITSFMGITDNYAYFVKHGYDVHVVKFDTISYSISNIIYISSDAEFAFASAIDRSTGFAYIGTVQSPGRFIKIEVTENFSIKQEFCGLIILIMIFLIFF
ncbi:hypothetical protein M0811_04768 [Anaeramoeba ignava]|uniref:Uncharacterized protein n=1 Tax=Anaeramoeba ignava TaxID=1746090 RepID=A0A9Q0LVZ2_ANAIG|nr:hypothetical protein M0811_04768 [Anaeramoeba ignava]